MKKANDGVSLLACAKLFSLRKSELQ